MELPCRRPRNLCDSGLLADQRAIEVAQEPDLSPRDVTTWFAKPICHFNFYFR
jgi:hypothetical protein